MPVPEPSYRRRQPAKLSDSNPAQETRNGPHVEIPLYMDESEGILRRDSSLDDKRRALLFDLYHDAKGPDDLSRRLQWHDLSNETKNALYLAKQRTHSPNPVSRVEDALRRMASLPQNVLEAVERFPTTARALVASALKGFDTK